jgi:hypothetical protein
VTRDDARKLIGGYATGSLTESERRLLFEAAMEDQDLFDELAREQELKELLDQPGARDRLIAAVTPTGRSGAVKRPIWIWSAIAMAAVVFGVSTWSLLRTPKPAEVARVEPRAAQPAPPAAVDRVQPSLPLKSPPPANRPAAEKKAAPAPPAGAPAAEAKKDERGASLDAAQPTAAAPAAPPPPPKQQTQSQQAAPQSSPSQQAPSPQATQQNVEVQAQSALLPPAPIAPRRSAAGGGGAGTVRSLAGRALAAKPARFGFDYTLEPEFLVLKFAADGWLSLHFAPGDDTIALAHVTAGQTRREAIPNNATEAAIVFAVEAQTDPTLGVQFTRTDKAGTVEDASGTRIEFLLKFY